MLCNEMECYETKSAMRSNVMQLSGMLYYENECYETKSVIRSNFMQ